VSKRKPQVGMKVRFRKRGTFKDPLRTCINGNYFSGLVDNYKKDYLKGKEPYKIAQVLNNDYVGMKCKNGTVITFSWWWFIPV
jgi:hypothetical protein